MTDTSPSGTCIQPLLVVRDAAAAIEFYKEVFGATEVWRLMHYHRVGHAILRIGSSELALLDEFPEAGIVTREGPRLMVWVPDVDAVLQAAIARGASLTGEANTQWWGVRGGSFRDPYGQQWSVLSVVEPISIQEMQKRADDLDLYPPPEKTP